jgi:hypothetical protein
MPEEITVKKVFKNTQTDKGRLESHERDGWIVKNDMKKMDVRSWKK